MKLEPTASNFLWNLIYLHLFENDIKKAYIHLTSVYKISLNFPEKISGLLLDYWTDQKESTITEIALLSARHYHFELRKHVFLVAFLVEKKLIPINEATQLLFFPGQNFDSLPFLIKKIFDIVWLLEEDKKEGRLLPDEDNILADALHELFLEIKTRKDS